MDDNPELELEAEALSKAWLDTIRNERITDPGRIGELPEDFEETEAGKSEVHST